MEIIISKRATERFETPSGDQAQYDWRRYEISITNDKKRDKCVLAIADNDHYEL